MLSIRCMVASLLALFVLPGCAADDAASDAAQVDMAPSVCKMPAGQYLTDITVTKTSCAYLPAEKLHVRGYSSVNIELECYTEYAPATYTREESFDRLPCDDSQAGTCQASYYAIMHTKEREFTMKRLVTYRCQRMPDDEADVCTCDAYGDAVGVFDY